jgi:hypothetical protein
MVCFVSLRNSLLKHNKYQQFVPQVPLLGDVGGEERHELDLVGLMHVLSSKGLVKVIQPAHGVILAIIFGEGQHVVSAQGSFNLRGSKGKGCRGCISACNDGWVTLNGGRQFVFSAPSMSGGVAGQMRRCG